MQLRFLVHLLVILVAAFFMTREIIGLTIDIRRIIFIPYITILFLDILYLMASLKNRPKLMDKKNSSVLISCLVSVHPVFVIFCSANPILTASLKTTGIILNLFVGFFILWALLSLRSNLTVLPEANTLVTSGPYRYIRHPLYFAYIVLALDEVMVFQSASVAFFALMQAVLVIIRADREEKVLLKAIPEYHEYRQKTFWFFLRRRSVEFQ